MPEFSQSSSSLSSAGYSAVLIDSLCKQLYKSGQPFLRTRAMLSHIYPERANTHPFKCIPVCLLRNPNAIPRLTF